MFTLYFFYIAASLTTKNSEKLKKTKVTTHI